MVGRTILSNPRASVRSSLPTRIPVRHQGQRQGALTVRARGEQEAPAIAGDVVDVGRSETRKLPARVKQLPGWLAGETPGGSFDVHGHHPAIGSEIVELSAIAAPAWLFSAIIGDAEIQGGAGKTRYVYLTAAGFVRAIGEPSAVRGELSLRPVKWALEHRGSLALGQI